jgi:hypothetical protein
MSDNKQLINFLLPRHMNEDMRVLCEKRGLTRTGLLTQLIYRELVSDATRERDMKRNHNLPDFFSTSDVEVVNSDW